MQGGTECAQGLRTGDKAGFEKGMQDLSAFMPTIDPLLHPAPSVGPDSYWAQLR